MLSPEEREQLDTKEKERLAEIEINRIIDQEMKASFDRMGLDYQNNKDDTPISIKMAFSKTACEYYSSKHRALAEQDSADRTGTTTADEASPIAEETDQSDDTLIKTETTDENKQIQDEVEKEQAPFAHLSRAELLKRIGIIN